MAKVRTRILPDRAESQSVTHHPDGGINAAQA